MTPNVTRARRDINNFAAFVRRTGLTGWVDRNARAQFRRALTSVLAVEDELGVGAAADMSDRLTRLRQEATEKGLLTAEDVSRIEREVCA